MFGILFHFSFFSSWIIWHWWNWIQYDHSSPSLWTNFMCYGLIWQEGFNLPKTESPLKDFVCMTHLPAGKLSRVGVCQKWNIFTIAVVLDETLIYYYITRVSLALNWIICTTKHKFYALNNNCKWNLVLESVLKLAHLEGFRMWQNKIFTC